MLGHFPSPHPDELLYSICARFTSRVGYSSAKSVIHELFGDSGVAAIDLPNNLNHLSAALPAGSSLTADRLINQHTLIPFYCAFLPCERVAQLKADLQSNRGQAGYMRSGVMASRIPTPGRLRFCSVCAQEDERQLRETYWRRTHQVPGVEVCLAHEVFLDEGDVCRRAGRINLQFVTADDAIRASTPRRLDLSNHDHQVLLQIARDVEWLLENPIPGSAPAALHNRYLKLLIGRRLATHTGSIHVKALLNEFKRHYSADLLKFLHCEFTGSDYLKTNWLLRLVRPPRHAQHPLYHLLLIRFLGSTAEEFFGLQDERSLFGRGPWPCLNPAADHFREAVIRECKLSSRLREGRPTATFSCGCGFTYARSGPDTSPEDRFCVSKMFSFGPVWEAKLKELWEESLQSLSEVGRKLGVDPLTVRRHASRMRLSFSRSGKQLKPLKHTTQLKGKAVSAEWEKKRYQFRSKWLSARKQKPEVTLKALRGKLSREYAWLRQNDSEWLEEHKPRPRRRNLPITSVDWKRRDAEYAAAVRVAASRLKEALGSPVQVTRTAIGRALGAITLLRQKLHKMPLTAQVLDTVVETREQYAVRRVWWAADLYCQEYILPREWQLVMRANVYSLKETSAVKCAVEDAMNMLRSRLSGIQMAQADL